MNTSEGRSPLPSEKTPNEELNVRSSSHTKPFMKGRDDREDGGVDLGGTTTTSSIVDLQHGGLDLVGTTSPLQTKDYPMVADVYTQHSPEYATDTAQTSIGWIRDGSFRSEGYAGNGSSSSRYNPSSYNTNGEGGLGYYAGSSSSYDANASYNTTGASFGGSTSSTNHMPNGNHASGPNGNYASDLYIPSNRIPGPHPVAGMGGDDSRNPSHESNTRNGNGANVPHGTNVPRNRGLTRYSQAEKDFWDVTSPHKRRAAPWYENLFGAVFMRNSQRRQRIEVDTRSIEDREEFMTPKSTHAYPTEDPNNANLRAEAMTLQDSLRGGQEGGGNSSVMVADPQAGSRSSTNASMQPERKKMTDTVKALFMKAVNKNPGMAVSPVAGERSPKKFNFRSFADWWKTLFAKTARACIDRVKDNGCAGGPKAVFQRMSNPTANVRNQYGESWSNSGNYSGNPHFRDGKRRNGDNRSNKSDVSRTGSFSSAVGVDIEVLESIDNLQRADSFMSFPDDGENGERFEALSVFAKKLEFTDEDEDPRKVAIEKWKHLSETRQYFPLAVSSSLNINFEPTVCNGDSSKDVEPKLSVRFRNVEAASEQEVDLLEGMLPEMLVNVKEMLDSRNSRSVTNGESSSRSSSKGEASQEKASTPDNESKTTKAREATRAREAVDDDKTTKKTTKVDNSTEEASNKSVSSKSPKPASLTRATAEILVPQVLTLIRARTGGEENGPAKTIGRFDAEVLRLFFGNHHLSEKDEKFMSSEIVLPNTIKDAIDAVKHSDSNPEAAQHALAYLLKAVRQHIIEFWAFFGGIEVVLLRYARVTKLSPELTWLRMSRTALWFQYAPELQSMWDRFEKSMQTASGTSVRKELENTDINYLSVLENGARVADNGVTRLLQDRSAFDRLSGNSDESEANSKDDKEDAFFKCLRKDVKFFGASAESPALQRNVMWIKRFKRVVREDRERLEQEKRLNNGASNSDPEKPSRNDPEKASSPNDADSKAKANGMAGTPDTIDQDDLSTVNSILGSIGKSKSPFTTLLHTMLYDNQILDDIHRQKLFPCIGTFFPSLKFPDHRSSSKPMPRVAEFLKEKAGGVPLRVNLSQRQEYLSRRDCPLGPDISSLPVEYWDLGNYDVNDLFAMYTETDIRDAYLLYSFRKQLTQNRTIVRDEPVESHCASPSTSPLHQPLAGNLPSDEAKSIAPPGLPSNMNGENGNSGNDGDTTTERNDQSDQTEGGIASGTDGTIENGTDGMEVKRRGSANSDDLRAALTADHPRLSHRCPNDALLKNAPLSAAYQSSRIPPASGCVVLINFNGMSLWKASKQLKCLSRMAVIFGKYGEEHFPANIKKCVMINAPTYLDMAWKVVSPYLSEATRKSVEVAPSNKVDEVLESLLDADTLDNLKERMMYY